MNENILYLLICPNCKSSLRDEPISLFCAHCGSTFPSLDGVHDLRPDRSIDTLLDIDEYDGAHGVSGVHYTTMAVLR